MAVFEGVVKVTRTLRTTRGRWSMPDHRRKPWTTVMVLCDDRPQTRAGMAFQVRWGAESRAAAKGDAERCEGHRVRVTCTPRPFGNGLGAHVTRGMVECLDEAEHVLTALGSVGGNRAARRR